MEPSEMTDEQLNKVIETGILEEPILEPESKEVEAIAEAPEEAEPEVVEEEEEAKVETPAETPPSNRLLTRAQKLLEKYGPPQERQAPRRNDALDYSQALDADPEVIEQLNADRQRTEQTYYNEGLRKAEAIEFKTNIRLDLPLVAPMMAKLDPRDAEVLDREYLNTVGFDPATGNVERPNIGYAEFIEARIEMAKRMGESMNAESVKNIAKQASMTGLRPDGSSAKRLNLNQAPENMSIEELYASIGQTAPKK